MGVAEKTKFWRNLGKTLNTSVGSKVAEATGTLVNRTMAAADRLELADQPPLTAVSGPLSDHRVALVSTGGFYLEGDEPFDVDRAEGDPTFRVIDADADLEAIRIAHTHYSHRYVEKDLNVLFPLEHLRRLEAEGVVGLGPRAYSFGFGGWLTSAFIEPPDGTAHQLARELAEDEVDLAVIVPA